MNGCDIFEFIKFFHENGSATQQRIYGREEEKIELTITWYERGSKGAGEYSPSLFLLMIFIAFCLLILSIGFIASGIHKYSQIWRKSHYERQRVAALADTTDTKSPTMIGRIMAMGKKRRRSIKPAANVSFKNEKNGSESKVTIFRDSIGVERSDKT